MDSYLIRIIFAGDTQVGKTQIINRFVNNSFKEEELATIGVDFSIKIVYLENQIIRLQIWDIAGRERFQGLTSSYYLAANALIFVYDITNSSSFLRMQRDIRNFIERGQFSNSVVYMIIANKVDLESIREISKEEGMELANQYNMHYYEVSSKEDEGIQDAFKLIILEAKLIIDRDQLLDRELPPVFVSNAPARRYNCY